MSSDGQTASVYVLCNTRNGEPSIDCWPSRVLYGKTDAVSRFQHYCLEQQQQQQQQQQLQQQQQSYQHGNITSTFFALKHSEWRGLFQEVWPFWLL